MNRINYKSTIRNITNHNFLLKSIIMKLKNPLNIFALLAIGSLSFLYACGGGGEQSTSDGSTSATQETEVVAVDDPDAKSEGKGVGRFTDVKLEPLDKALAAKGEAIFTAKCSACHRTTDEKLVGPGLKNITNLREPEWIMNMITNPEEMTKKDPVAKALFEKHLVQMTFQDVSDDETRAILEYFRQNDSQ